MANFEPNAIIRGVQLTVVGGIRALQNPGLFKYKHYRQAAIAVAAGFAISVLISAPIFLVKFGLYASSFFVNFDRVTWDDSLVEGINFVEKNVLQVPFFLMSLMRYVTPTLDEMFMDSLEWVDKTYTEKHKLDNDKHALRQMYYPNLKAYSSHGGTSAAQGARKKSAWAGVSAFLMRFGRRTGMSLAVYLFTFIPYIGRFILPAVSFYTFNKFIDLPVAAGIFGAGVFLPKKYFVLFLQSYFSSRSLMRELLEPYFARIHFSKEQKKRWFHDREGVLFGFGVGFYLFTRIPLFGVLIYGIAEASTAYLITKVTDPPPAPAQSEGFAESQITWTNKTKFLTLPLGDIDAVNTGNLQVPTAGAFDAQPQTPSEKKAL